MAAEVFSIGSVRVVPMISSTVPASAQQASKPYIKMVPPFPVAYTLESGDEIDPLPNEKLDVMPWTMAQDAMEYAIWEAAGRKGKMPSFGDVVDQLCHGRLSLHMGLGSSIYFERRTDALSMKQYFVVNALDDLCEAESGFM